MILSIVISTITLTIITAVIPYYLNYIVEGSLVSILLFLKVIIEIVHLFRSNVYSPFESSPDLFNSSS